MSVSYSDEIFDELSSATPDWPLDAEIKSAVFAWCEANRESITQAVAARLDFNTLSELVRL